MSELTKIKSAQEAAALIPNHAVMTVSASSGLNCPDAMLRAIGERFDATGSPSNVTSIHPIAAGDMYGIEGIDHLAKKGLLKTVLAGSYPSGPSSKPMPKIWEMITENEIAAYNVPSGILFDMHRDAAVFKPGVLTQVGMGTFVDPAQEGAAMNAQAAEQPIVQRVNFADDSWLHFSPIKPNVAILRGTTADEHGNISFEQEGALLGALDQALCVRNLGGLVIVQVKRVVKADSIPTQQVHIPSHLVDVVVVDSIQMQTTQTQYDPSISGEIQVSESTFEPIELSVEKVIARRAAQELNDGDTANLGFGISANVPRILFEEAEHKRVTWAIEQGAVGGMPLLGFQFGCAANADAIVRSSDQFVYFQGGGFDITFLSFLQIDQLGNVNVSRLSGKPYLTAGCGGFVDIVNRAKRIVFSGQFMAGAKFSVDAGSLSVTREGRAKKLVERVEQITFNGQRAIQQGQDVLYVTERCVMKLTPNGLMVTEIAPGFDLQSDILDQAEFPLLVSDSLITFSDALYLERSKNVSDS